MEDLGLQHPALGEMKPGQALVPGAPPDDDKVISAFQATARAHRTPSQERGLGRAGLALSFI